MSEAGKTALNTDRELWRELGEFGMEAYAPSVHVTMSGGIGINVGGVVYVKTLREWHALAAAIPPWPKTLPDEAISSDQIRGMLTGMELGPNGTGPWHRTDGNGDLVLMARAASMLLGELLYLRREMSDRAQLAARA